MKRYQPVINWYGSSPGAGMQENERGQYYHKDDVAELQRAIRIAYHDGVLGGSPLQASTLELLKSLMVTDS